MEISIRTGSQAMADVAIAHSAQANNDFPEIHTVQINTLKIDSTRGVTSTISGVRLLAR